MARRRRLNPPQKLASYEPHPHQVIFHQDMHKYRALVTGVGAGKTRMGVEEIMKWTQIFPGSLGVIGRLTSKALRETTQRRFFEVCPQAMIEEFNKTEGHLWIKTPVTDEEGFPVYSEILFVHLDDPGPLGSLDISYFWIDEAHEPDGAEVPEQTFQMLQARLRHPVGPWRGFITSNSGGKDWIWKWFFSDQSPEEFIGWTAPSDANSKYLPPGYVAELRRNNPETWVQRFLDASFDAFEGQVYVDFDEKYHVYDPAMIEISPHWDHGCGFDFGITAPTSVIYGCVDQDDEIWIYDEIYQANAGIADMSVKIIDRGITEPFADPSVTTRGPGKKSPKDLYLEEGVNLLPTSNDEDYFMSLFIKLLRQRNSRGEGVIHISKKCTNLIEQIKREAWDPMTIVGTTHDKLKKQPNHARDAFKYWLNTFGLHPGMLQPISPGFSKVDLSEFHESFSEDEDLYDENYPHKGIRRKIING